MPVRSSTIGHDTSPGQHFQFFSNNFINASGIIMSIIGQVGQNVGLPIWLASAPSGHSIDTYFVLLYTCILFTLVFFIGSCVQYAYGQFTLETLFKSHLHKDVLIEYFLVGFFTALNGLFLVFAAPPDRCPAFLQSALTNTMIPLVIIFRILILRKIPSLIQCLCSLGVISGLFLTSIPTIFNLDPSASQESGSHGIWRILWPLIFAFSFVPAAIYTVLEEKYLQKTSQITPDGSVPNNNNAPSGIIAVIRESITSGSSGGKVSNKSGKSNKSNKSNEHKSPINVINIGNYKNSKGSSGNRSRGSSKGSKGSKGSRRRKLTVYDSDHPVPMSVFFTLVSGFQTITFVFLFWYDLLPTIGYAKSIDGLLNNFWQSLKYTFLLDGAKTMCLIGNWIFVFFYCITSYGQGILLRYSEGAIYSSMVNAMVTPIGEIFWMLFNSATDFKWKPTWTSTSYYPLLGLVIIVPCVFIYNVYGDNGSNSGNKNDNESDSSSTGRGGFRTGGGSLQYESGNDALLAGVVEQDEVNMSVASNNGMSDSLRKSTQLSTPMRD